MGLPINIKELINGIVVEWERIEFKENWNPESVMHTICAFANDINNWGGGYIIIGIEEKDGKPILPPKGLQQNQLDPYQRKLLQICKRITPNYTPIAQPYDYNGKHILLLWVPGGDNRPYKAPEILAKGSQYFRWIRKFSNTVKPAPADDQRLLNLSGKIPFDDRINHHAKVNDFQLALITEYLAEIKSSIVIDNDTSIEEISSALQIARGPSEYIKPLNVGLLFFTPDPEKFFPGAQIDVVEFQDEAGDNLVEKIFKGPLHDQVRSALRYIQNSIIKEKITKIASVAEANRQFNYPYEAIEEALVNAVYHKSYEQRNPVEVSIRKDCIEILSYPGPLPPVDNDKLKQGRVRARNYRNRRIGDFLKELHLTEGRSTGLPKIRKALKDNGSPDPIFETDNDTTYFFVKITINKEFVPSLSKEVSQTGEQVAEEISQHLIDLVVPSLSQVCPELSKTEKFAKIIIYCSKPHKIVEIMEVVGETNRSRFRKNYIDKLIDWGYIAYTIPETLKDPNQEYVITQKGLKLFN
ncbi:MAG: putative DNA binding domain-containing protein [Candidatus Cloacimonetes bacterium]|nr:putative DNA binding domain-containing protein [Candidatus Cloacimonadota bacterium]